MFEKKITHTECNARTLDCPVARSIFMQTASHRNKRRKLATSGAHAYPLHIMTRTLVIAGTHSGCGKTTTSLALMAALVRRGCRVQAFKAGPDFIDPGHHRRITGRPSHNLDGWMMGQDQVKATYQRYAADADVVVIEGVMGLYDGFSGSTEDGSTAQIAKWLEAPVVLVADARSMARSAAAMVSGYASFDPELSMAGVLFNRIGSDNHASLIEEAMSHSTDLPALGFLKRSEDLCLPSRHLGLVTDQEHSLSTDTVTTLADWIESGCNVGRLLSLASENTPPAKPAPPPVAPTARIGIPRDAAFCFYYEENLRLLKQAGAKLVEFSPLVDSALPSGLDGMYLGGGYPEIHAEQLAANSNMRMEIREFCQSGKQVYAECGGFMYLMDSITDAHGTKHPMCGVYSFEANMNDRFRALGYREAVTTHPSILGPSWTMCRGHEFHYSSISVQDTETTAIYKVQNRKGWSDQMEGFVRGNTLGSYIHLHFGSNPEVARAIVNACTRTKG